MNEKQGGPIRQLFPLCILIACLTISTGATAYNEARDMKLFRQEEETRFLLLLKSMPKYSVTEIDRNQIELSLCDTVKTPLLNKKITQNEDIISLSGEVKSTALRFHVRLPGPLREIFSSWLANEKILYVEMRSSGENHAQEQGSVRSPVKLKNLRFGIRETATRLVMELDQKAPWEITYCEEDAITVKLPTGTRSPKRKEYGPMKRLKKVFLRQGEDSTDIVNQLEAHIDHLGIFWLRDGNRFVMDFADSPLKTIDKNLLLFPKPERAESDRNELGDREDETELKVENAEEDNISESEMTFVLRKKVPKKTKREESNESGQASSESLEKKDPIYDLDSEETLLYTNILGAQELEDYEKGVALIDQFLAKFPGSSLTERLLFLRGDFQFFIFKNGRESLYPEIIESYRNAISRFGHSKNVPQAYVKMAQLNSFTENHYAAIGFLNLALARFGKGDYLPQAYLTRGNIYLKLNQPEKAIEDFKRVLTQYPQTPYVDEARLGIANYFHAMGVYEEAEKRLKEISDSKGDFYLDYPEYLFLTARNYLYAKKYALAREYLFRALNVGHQPETDDLLLCHIGDSYYHQSKEREAEKIYTLVVDDYPGSEGAAIAKLRLANFAPGLAMLREVYEKNFNKPIGDLALIEMANKFFEKGRFSIVMETLKELIKKPALSEIQKEAKELYYRATEKEIKRLHRTREYKRLTELYGAEKQKITRDIDPEVLFVVAQSFDKLGQYEEAKSILLRIKPYDLSRTSKGNYILSLASVYLREGDDDNSVKLLEKNIEKKFLAADQQKMALLLADLYRKNRRFEDAYKLYQSVTRGRRVLPESEIARAYLIMGSISNQRAQYEKAREALNRCIALAEKDTEIQGLIQSAFILLGNSYRREGKNWEAIKAYEHGFGSGYGPENSDYWEMRFRLALSYLEVGENLKAEPLLNEISEEGDPLLQQKVLIKLGTIGLKKQLRRLSIWPDVGEGSL